MKKIFKYQLANVDLQNVEMPQGSEILCIQTQNEIPCIWALVDPNKEPINRRIGIFGTGQELPMLPINENATYIGTYQLQMSELGGTLVFHCFDIV